MKKLKEELNRRKVEITAPSSNEISEKVHLTAILVKVLDEEKLCTGKYCECKNAGIPCHAEVCACCAHVPSNSTSSKCCNPSGNFIYCFDKVQTYRDKVLQTITNQI